MHVEYCNEVLECISVWERFPDPIIRDVHDLSKGSKIIEYPLLNSVGMYQDTLFNTRQIKILKHELSLYRCNSSDEAAELVESLLGYIDSVNYDTVENMSIYLRFVGE